MSGPAAGDVPARSAAGLLATPRFEVVPLRGVEEQVARLPAGAHVAVTCSPRKGVDATLDLADRLAAAGIRAIPHVAARTVRDGGHLGELLGRLAGRFGDVFVVGGDGPRPAGPYDGALALLRAIPAAGPVPPRIGVAAYPEGHPLIGDAALLDALLAKQPLAHYLVTQLCFDMRALGRWLAAIRARGVRLDAYVGLPGVLERRKLVEVSLRVGVGDSLRYVSGRRGMVTGLLRRHSFRPDRLLADLRPLVADPALGIAGLHLNTFNQVAATESWRKRWLA